MLTASIALVDNRHVSSIYGASPVSAKPAGRAVHGLMSTSSVATLMVSRKLNGLRSSVTKVAMPRVMLSCTSQRQVWDHVA